MTKPNATADLVIKSADIYIARIGDDPINTEAVKAIEFGEDSKIELVDGNIHLRNIKLFFTIPDNAIQQDDWPEMKPQQENVGEACESCQ